MQTVSTGAVMTPCGPLRYVRHCGATWYSASDLAQFGLIVPIMSATFDTTVGAAIVDEHDTNKILATHPDPEMASWAKWWANTREQRS